MNSEHLQPVAIETILYPKNFKDKIAYVGKTCEFTPCGWAKIEGEFFPLGYKVVTEQLKSLGLRNNPNIMTFPVGEWVMQPEGEIIPGKEDFGGIWTALHKGSIATLKNYMMEKYNTKTRAFLTAMNKPVYANSYRIKSAGVMLLSEIF